MDKYQYRVTVNGTASKVTDNPPANWDQIAQVIEDRGGIATMERRFVTDRSYLEWLGDDKQSYMILGNTVVSPWRVFAEMEVR